MVSLNNTKHGMYLPTSCGMFIENRSLPCYICVSGASPKCKQGILNIIFKTLMSGWKIESKNLQFFGRMASFRINPPQCPVTLMCKKSVLFMVKTVWNLIRALLCCCDNIKILVVLIIEQEPDHVVVSLGVHVQRAGELDAVKLLITKSKGRKAVH